MRTILNNSDDIVSKYENILGGDTKFLTSIVEKFSQYKSRAKRDKLHFELTFGQFDHMCKQNCTYCEASPLEKSIGVDRVDNEVGYTITNSVPSCWECNRSKNNMSLAEFKIHVDKYRSPNKNPDKKLYFQVIITDIELLLRFRDDYLFSSEEKANIFRLKMEKHNNKPNSTKIVKSFR